MFVVSEKINKYFSLLLKFIFFTLFIIFINLMHDFKGDNDLEIILANIIVYMYLLTFTVILFVLYRKFHKYYNYILFLCPSIPILNLLYQIYQTRNL